MMHLFRMRMQEGIPIKQYVEDSNNEVFLYLYELHLVLILALLSSKNSMLAMVVFFEESGGAKRLLL